MSAPILQTHAGIKVVRDDLHPGGTKARYIRALFDGHQELVYASPAEGGAQYALAHCAAELGRRATIFVAKRATPHPRAIQAKGLGARVMQVAPGYLTVVQKRAAEYCAATGAALVPFGVNEPKAIATIRDAARALSIEPDEVWCAAGSGVLSRGLAQAFPKARRHAVQIGRTLTAEDVAGAKIHVYPAPFSRAVGCADFPADPHYDAKAWQICKARRGAGLVLFWNVTGPAQ